jgi:hypothetical protein
MVKISLDILSIPQGTHHCPSSFKSHSMSADGNNESDSNRLGHPSATVDKHCTAILDRIFVKRDHPTQTLLHAC